jgi:tRNA (guanine-N7-)-methyltransferase
LRHYSFFIFIFASMAQKKLMRFEAIKTFPNVLQYPEGIAGNWKNFFNNDNPVYLELACGKGEYTVELARTFPQRNFVGVDLKGNRIYVGAKKCLEQEIANAGFLRTQIVRINDYFARGEAKEIWLTFPDPHLRKSKAKKRLTHPRFLRLYQQFLPEAGLIHLKTDSPDLFAFTLLVIEMYGLRLHACEDNVYAQPEIKQELKIKTYYESLDIAQSKRIHYLCFSLPSAPLADLDDILQKTVNANEPATS